jgi:hypothetical protein
VSISIRPFASAVRSIPVENARPAPVNTATRTSRAAASSLARALEIDDPGGVARVEHVRPVERDVREGALRFVEDTGFGAHG